LEHYSKMRIDCYPFHAVHMSEHRWEICCWKPWN